MKSIQSRRYLFAVYSEIERLDFEQLDKICDRFFILFPLATEQIPFPLVRRLQRLGKGVKWVPLEEADAAQLPVQLAFLLGRLHQKLPTDIEFAVLSDNPAFDALVQFIFEKGRPCVRVRATKEQAAAAAWALKNTEPKLVSEAAIILPSKNPGEFSDPKIPQEAAKISPSKNPGEFSNQIFHRNGPALHQNGDSEKTAAPRPFPAEQPAIVATTSADETTLRGTARDIVERLLRSGNRPAEVATLKQYISLTNQHLPPGATEKIITFLAMNHEIEIQDKEVVYHF